MVWPCKQNVSQRLPKQNIYDKVSGKSPVGRPQTRWLDYIEDLGWNRLELHPSEMQSVLVDREVWRLNRELLALGKACKKKAKFTKQEKNPFHQQLDAL